VRREIKRDPTCNRQQRTDQHVALAAGAEERESIGDDSGDGFEIPSELYPEEKGGGGCAIRVQLILEKIFQGNKTENLKLR
jgi:hypothetical protein